MKKKTTKQQTMKQILVNLSVLKDDFNNFRDWDTSDETNWEAMIDLLEVIEKQINSI